MPFRVGPTELIIILVIIMMIFGVGKLPQVGQTLGKAMREFRKSQNEDVEPETPTPAVAQSVTQESETPTPAVAQSVTQEPDEKTPSSPT